MLSSTNSDTCSDEEERLERLDHAIEVGENHLEKLKATPVIQSEPKIKLPTPKNPKMKKYLDDATEFLEKGKSCLLSVIQLLRT